MEGVMKKASIIITLATFAFLTFAVFGPAFAGPYQKRPVNQKTQISKGVSTGVISHREANRLYSQQARIDAQRAIYLSDGVLTASEQRSLQRLQNQASRCIYRQSTDWNNW